MTHRRRCAMVELDNGRALPSLLASTLSGNARTLASGHDRLPLRRHHVSLKHNMTQMAHLTRGECRVTNGQQHGIHALDADSDRVRTGGQGSRVVEVFDVAIMTYLLHFDSSHEGLGNTLLLVCANIFWRQHQEGIEWNGEFSAGDTYHNEWVGELTVGELSRDDLVEAAGGNCGSLSWRWKRTPDDRRNQGQFII
ncbi:hypothetical protein JB92DRAFT_1042410 [Gautieria morchelliformis]|nr:hypothetical protein JB92DRAFT_1042410 [Gautieria morchelliformis]